jgi:hypothetical protein
MLKSRHHADIWHGHQLTCRLVSLGFLSNPTALVCVGPRRSRFDQPACYTVPSLSGGLDPPARELPGMKYTSAVIAGALFSAAWVVPAAMAQPACVAANASVPPGANTTDRSAPFFIDTTGLDLSTTPPTRNPSNREYPRATELPDGTLPSAGAEGNFIIGPTHRAAPETAAHDNVPHGTVYSFTISSKDSVIYNPGVVRDDPPNCRNGSVYGAQTAPGDRSNILVTTPEAGRAR